MRIKKKILVVFTIIFSVTFLIILSIQGNKQKFNILSDVDIDLSDYTDISNVGIEIKKFTRDCRYCIQNKYDIEIFHYDNDKYPNVKKFSIDHGLISYNSSMSQYNAINMFIVDEPDKLYSFGDSRVGVYIDDRIGEIYKYVYLNKCSLEKIIELSYTEDESKRDRIQNILSELELINYSGNREYVLCSKTITDFNTLKIYNDTYNEFKLTEDQRLNKDDIPSNVLNIIDNYIVKKDSIKISTLYTSYIPYDSNKVAEYYQLKEKVIPKNTGYKLKYRVAKRDCDSYYEDESQDIVSYKYAVGNDNESSWKEVIETSYTSYGESNTDNYNFKYILPKNYEVYADMDLDNNIFEEEIQCEYDIYKYKYIVKYNEEYQLDDLASRWGNKVNYLYYKTDSGNQVSTEAFNVNVGYCDFEHYLLLDDTCIVAEIILGKPYTGSNYKYKKIIEYANKKYEYDEV